MNLFSYGTFQDPDVIALVAGGSSFEILGPATLEGFSALYVENEQYPILISSPLEKVEGTVVRSLSKEFWSRLDFFEDNYQKIELEVILNNSPLHCHVYSEETGKVSGGIRWLLEKWIENDKDDFLKKAEVFMNAYGTGNEGVW